MPSKGTQTIEKAGEWNKEWRAMHGHIVPQKTVWNMTTKDDPGTLPINLYAADSLTVQSLDFTVQSEAAAVLVPHREKTETFHKLSQIVCVRALFQWYSSILHNGLSAIECECCHEEGESQSFHSWDPFNPVLLTEDAERYVDVSNIVRALTFYNYREDTLKLEEDYFILLCDVLHHTNEIVTVAEAPESVEMTER